MKSTQSSRAWGGLSECSLVPSFSIFQILQWRLLYLEGEPNSDTSLEGLALPMPPAWPPDSLSVCLLLLIRIPVIRFRAHADPL